jgi:hypothetical protein
MTEDCIEMSRTCRGLNSPVVSGRLVLLAVTLLMSSCTLAFATPTPDQIRAVLVYKFAQFVQWPSDDGTASGPIHVGVLGSDAIRSALEVALGTKSLRGRGFEIRTYKRPEEVIDCSIVVVDATQSRQTLILRALPKEGLLTIGEGASFAREGGVIAVILDGEQVKFDINLAAAEEAGLTINATILGLAREVGRW